MYISFDQFSMNQEILVPIWFGLFNINFHNYYYINNNAKKIEISIFELENWSK